MKAYTLSPDALEDLQDIWDFIAEGSRDAASRVQEELFTAFKGLARTPGKGHFRRDLTDKPVRFFAVRAYLIVYFPDRKPLEIIGILHGARDVPTLLSQR